MRIEQIEAINCEKPFIIITVNINWALLFCVTFLKALIFLTVNHLCLRMLLSVPFFYSGSQNIIFMFTYLLTNGLCTHKLLLCMLSYECRHFHLSFACNGSNGSKASTTEEEVQKRNHFKKASFECIFKQFLSRTWRIIIVQWEKYNI